MRDNRFVTFASAQPAMSVTAILGQTPPVPADGYGGWSLVNRPRRKALTVWDGINPLRELVTVIIGIKPGSRGGIADSLPLNLSATQDRETLERMAQPPFPGAEPPLITVVGTVPHANDGPWVIESFDWDPTPIYSPSGFLVRQAVTVHLLEYVRDDRLADLTAAQTAVLQANVQSASAARKAGGTPTKQKTYVAKSGDTLQTVAARVLGNYKSYFQLATLNGLSPDAKLVSGQKLLLP